MSMGGAISVLLNFTWTFSNRSKSRNFFCRQIYRGAASAKAIICIRAYSPTYAQKLRQKPHANAIERLTRKYLRERIEALEWGGCGKSEGGVGDGCACQGVGIGTVMHIKRR